MLVDVLFIQESKHIEPKCPVHLIPMGVVSMAAWLDRHDLRVEIVHHAIELTLDPDYDICADVAKSGAKLVCISLHWHATSRTVVNLAREIKRTNPDVAICIGGYTASTFADEILRNFPCIDYVIRGDGEQALLALARAVVEGEPLDDVPNLARIDEGKLVLSEKRHVNSGEDLGAYEFCRFDLMRSWQLYNQRGLMEGEIPLEGGKPGFFYCNAGRGCPYDCTFCGGSRTAQNYISGRINVSWRPVEAMMRDLLRMPEFNLDTWYNTYQPTPVEDWFFEMFAAIRASGLRIKMVQECLHIPSKRWIEEFARTFEPGSRLDFVMYNGDDELRRRNKKNYFSEQQIFDVLALTEPLGITTELCYLTGLPFERLEHFEAHFRHITTLRERYDVNVNCEILAIEPRAPMNVSPKAASHHHARHDVHGLLRASQGAGVHRLHAGPLQRARRSGSGCVHAGRARLSREDVRLHRCARRRSSAPDDGARESLETLVRGLQPLCVLLRGSGFRGAGIVRGRAGQASRGMSGPERSEPKRRPAPTFQIPKGENVFVHQAFECCPYAGLITSKIHDYVELNGYTVVTSRRTLRSR